MLKHRDKTAIVYKNNHYSYADLLQHSLRYSDKFIVNGKTPEKILIFSENTPEYVFSIFGALRLKATIVPVDVMSTSKELKYIVNDCRPDIILTTHDKLNFIKDTVSEIEGFSAPILTPEDIETSDVGSLPIVELEIDDMEQVVAIIYTSGTTGSPKGVVLTYKNLWYNLDAVINKVPIYQENSRVILLLPLHHIFPFAGALLAPIYTGATIYIVENLAPETIIKTLQEGQINIMIGVPRLYDALAKGIMTKINNSLIAKLLFKIAKGVNSDSFSKKIFKTVHQKFGGQMEYFVSGGAALSSETGNIFKTLGFTVLEGYGMTECAPMITFTRPGDVKVGTCGKLLPGLELRFSEDNEILVKGPNVMKGYYNKPEDTADIIRDGWLYTGDVGKFDDAGRLIITGRIKEIIVTSNGKNINPVEIEHAILAESEAISDIAVLLHEGTLQAIVVPDMNAVRADTGKSIDEIVRADIEAYNAQSMGYKKIMNFHITSQDIPKTRLGKIQRYKLDSLVTVKDRVKDCEDISDKSSEYLSIKSFIDNETGESARGDDHFEIDLSLDSLGKVSLIAFIAENFNIQIQEEQMNELSSLNKLSAYIEANSSEQTLKTISWKQIFEETKEPIRLPKSGFFHWFMFNFFKIGFHLFYRLCRQGLKNIPRCGACIYVANHRSGFDPLFITAALGWGAVKNIFFFAKEKHFKSKYIKFMAKRNNVILVDINSNIKESLQQMYQVLKQGKSIIIFPEGTRSKNAIMKEFKESFAILSKELNVPVLPIAIIGSEQATYKKVRIPRFLSQISINVMPTELYAENESIKEFTLRIQNIIKQKIDSIK